MNIVIIGGGASGLTTASNIRKYDEDSQIMVFTTQKHVAYSPCAIPYVIGGHIEKFEDIIMHRPEEYMLKNIRIYTQSTVTKINKDQKEITYEDRNGNKQNLKYDKLVIATGGKPLIPPIPGKDLDGVFKVRTVEDGLKIQKYAEKSKNVVLVGGGAIGLELGSELANKGLNVTIAEMMPQLFPRSFDQEMSDKFQEHLQSKKITILTSSAVESINGETKVESVTIDGQERPADMVILSTGVRPQTELAESIGCEIGKFAIEVDEHMETSVEDVYAAGDCVQVTDAITGEITLSPLGTTAVRQGIILAKHLTGHDISFKPVLNSTVSQIGVMEMGAVGITEQEAKKQSLDVVVSSIDALSRARYYPETKPLHIKLIAKTDGTIIGCQMFGQEAVAERVDTMTAIISQQLKCEDVVSMEFSYAPPVSMVIDPIAQVAQICLEKIEELEEQEAQIEDEIPEEEVEEEAVEEVTDEDVIEEEILDEDVVEEDDEFLDEEEVVDDAEEIVDDEVDVEEKDLTADEDIESEDEASDENADEPEEESVVEDTEEDVASEEVDESSTEEVEEEVADESDVEPAEDENTVDDTQKAVDEDDVATEDDATQEEVSDEKADEPEDENVADDVADESDEVEAVEEVSGESDEEVEGDAQDTVVDESGDNESGEDEDVVEDAEDMASKEVDENSAENDEAVEDDATDESNVDETAPEEVSSEDDTQEKTVDANSEDETKDDGNEPVEDEKQEKDSAEMNFTEYLRNQGML